MSKDITELPEQKLQSWTPKKSVEYITAQDTKEEPAPNEDDIPFTQDDIEYIEREEIDFKVPADRQLVSVCGTLLAMPKDMQAVLEKIDNAGKPKPKPIVLTRKQKIWNFLLKPFRGKNANRK